MRLGFVFKEPTVSDCGPILDLVPSSSDSNQAVSEYLRWRDAAQGNLLQRVASGDLKMWTPLEVGNSSFIPLFGGSPSSDWVETVAVVLKFVETSGQRVRVVDLTSGGVTDGLRGGLSSRFKGRYRTASLGPAGSIDPIKGMTKSEVAALLSAVADSDQKGKGRGGALMVTHLIEIVCKCFNNGRKVTLGRLFEAIQLAQTGVPMPGSQLDVPEQTEILASVHSRLQNNRGMADAIFDLEALVRVLSSFEPKSKPTDNAGATTQGTIDVVRAIAPRGVEFDLATELLVARVATDLSQRKAEVDLVVLIGADELPEALLDFLADSVEQCGSQLLVFFERLNEDSAKRLGWRGSPIAGFFRMPNAKEAAIAADFLGKRHSFVLSGTSDTRGTNMDWGWSKASTSGVDQSTSRSCQIGQMFANTTRSVSRSSSTSNTVSASQSVSNSSTSNYSRVYEHLLDPAVFQGLESGALLVVDTSSGAATLASCNRDIARSKTVAWDYFFALTQ
jgi:hypothetical protein